MKKELAYYDIYPKVVPAHRRSRVTVRGLGSHADFENGKTYYVHIIPMEEMTRFINTPDYPIVSVCAEDKTLVFEHDFGAEQQYMIWIGNAPVRTDAQAAWRSNGKIELRMYALEEDLLALRPYMGNMHIHTCRSDGDESPAVTAAAYREAGYDFIAITDHHKYEPSIEAIDTYRDLDLDFRLFPGEEVHPFDNKFHVVNFAGDHSVNAIFRSDEAAYRREVAEILETLDLPEGFSHFEYASTLWAIRKIRGANGLSILCHPSWIYMGAYNIPTAMYRHFLKNPVYDALELINGGNRIEENSDQVTLWYNNAPVPGTVPPVVGCDDSHGAVNGEWFNIGKTCLMAKSLDREDLFDAIRSGLSCAVEQYHGQHARFYGPERLARFFRFLDSDYWPLHHALCAQEGQLMFRYINGDPVAADCLKLLKGQTDRLYAHVFGRE